ncbi:MAG TPA: hypothetical protein PLV06_04755 [Bacteroidales bacterium]|nr:hypothetical protein [Bacteroidales bacterium]HPF04077.1 hypothetical protein [Bacteroidales bacterium]HPJ58497.1 hypothetical protein [Bacteroidales bacterium]HPR11672.1 hypothetical protein [Bacteroidales bacterium]HRW85032.1 hypothetical protein [Bacteroidales bacterium]
MKKKKIIKPVEIVNGLVELNFDCSEESTDWLKAGRLQRLADAGDEKAKKELKRMRESKMFYEEDERS